MWPNRLPDRAPCEISGMTVNSNSLKPSYEVFSQQTESAFATRDGCFDAVDDASSWQEVGVVVADTVAVFLQRAEDGASQWLVVVRTTAEEHVVVHVFSETFVAVKRMKLPPGSCIYIRRHDTKWGIFSRSSSTNVAAYSI